MIYLIRHGETFFNREERVQGRVDSPLTALGIAQARAIGERLGRIAADEGGGWVVETSPLGRARRSADVIAEAAGWSPARIEPRLIEVSYGELEGLTREEIEARWPMFAGGEGLFCRAPGGESFSALMARAADWLAAREGGAPVAAITHAGVVRALRGLWLGLDEAAIRALDKPQDAVFRLSEGRVDRLDCAPLSSEAAEP